MPPIYYVGQQVVLHDVNQRRGAPPACGTITKIGRVRLDIEVSQGWRHEQYRIDDQTLCDNRHPGAWFRTLEQEEADARRQDDLAVLRAAGFTPTHPRPSDDTVHQVAELLRSLEGAALVLELEGDTND